MDDRAIQCKHTHYSAGLSKLGKGRQSNMFPVFHIVHMHMHVKHCKRMVSLSKHMGDITLSGLGNSWYTATHEYHSLYINDTNLEQPMKASHIATYT